MHYVKEVPFGVPCKTRLWFSDRVMEQVAAFRKKGDPDGAFWKKMKRYAMAGFELYERGQPPAIKHEWDGVCRVGITGSLFRIIGFYDGDRKSEFIAIDAFLKRGQQLSVPERRRIDEVARVRRDRDWKKVTDGGTGESGADAPRDSSDGQSFPRLAKRS